MGMMVFCVWVKESYSKLHELISLQIFSDLLLYASIDKIQHYNPGRQKDKNF